MTNVIWERKKQKFLKKKEIMEALHLHLVNGQKLEDKYSVFAKVIVSKCWKLYDFYETKVNRSVKNAVLPFHIPGSFPYHI